MIVKLQGRTLRAAAALAALLLTAWSCKGKKDEQPRPLVSMQEIKDLEERFMLELEKNRDKACIRAVLRGKAKDGSAGPDMIKVMEGGGPHLDACLDLLEEKNEALGRALFLDKEPGLRLVQIRPPGEPGFDRELVKAAASECAPLLEAMQSAVSHAEACSPYLPGKRGMPGMTVQVRLARLVSGAALQAHLGGDDRRAFELLLDGLRFDQDMDRGGVSWIIPMISLAADAHTLSMATWLLGRPEPLGDLLGEIDHELAGLIESEPHPASFIQGDYNDMVIHVLMRSIKGKNWSPPGGWHEGEEPAGAGSGGEDESARFKTLTLGSDEADDNALAWLAMEELAAQERRACPASSTPEQCYESLVLLSAELHESATLSTLKWLKKMTEFLLSWDPDARKRDFIIDMLKSIASSTPRYVALQGQRRFFVAALRVQAAFRLMAEKEGRCPDLEDFKTEPLSGLAVDPNSNQPMTVELGPDGAVVLSSQSFKDARDVELRLAFDCPPGL